MKAWRITLAIAGVSLVIFGIARLLTEIPAHSLMLLALWLIAALIIHDAILSPSVVGAGWVLRRTVPDRGRRYLQAALIMAAIVTVVAIPMIYLRNSQPPSKAMLLQNYGANLIVLLSIIAGLTLVRYGVRVARDRAAARQKTS